MQYYLLGILSIPFFWINYKIILSDIKIKKIPNKYLLYLLYLLPFYYIYTYYYFDINYSLFFGQILLTLIISFILYNFGIWSAGDAKYLLVLGLFIPHIGIIPFIGNIAILTIGYLLLYFIWFYFGKCLFNWKYSKSLYKNIYNDLRDKLNTFLKSGDGNFYKKVIAFRLFKWLVAFLVIFVSIRISRIYIFKDIFEDSEKSEWFLSLLQNYHIYLLIVFIGIFIGFIIGFRSLFRKTKNYIVKKSQIKGDYIELFFLAVLLIILSSFLVYEYLIDSEVLMRSLYLILSLYLGIFFIFVILRYSYKITFQIAESYYVDIKNLKVGDIVDKEYLVKMFGKQVALGYCHDFIEEEMMKRRKKIFSHSDPGVNFSNINNPIGEEDLKKLNKIYKKVNKYHGKNTSNYTENNTIKILNTFAFGGYIFIGFIITYIFGNTVISMITNFILKLITGVYN